MTKRFDRIPDTELTSYCGLVQHENHCRTAQEAADTLKERFGWETMSRLDDIKAAWKVLTAANEADEDEDDDDDDDEVQVVAVRPAKAAAAPKKPSPSPAAAKAAAVSTSGAKAAAAAAAGSTSGSKVSRAESKEAETGEGAVAQKKPAKSKAAAPADGAAPESTELPAVFSAGTMPVIIKSNAWGKKVLLCEVNDSEFNVQGDSGAVGRISVDTNSVSIDIKGAAYASCVRPVTFSPHTTPLFGLFFLVLS
jgi:hypothetical protein